MAAAAAASPYDFILESVGGASLGLALGALATDGICVTCGNSTGEQTCFEVRDFYMKDGTQLHGLYLGRYFGQDCRAMLDEVVAMAARGELRTPIAHVADWTGIGEAARQLAGQQIDGKLILRVS